MSQFSIDYADSLSGPWTKVITKTSSNSESGNDFSYDIPDYINKGAHQYWRLYIMNAGNNSSWCALIYQLHFSALK